MTPADLLGKAVSFDHQGKTLVGVVTAAQDNGLTPRGAIPDLLVTVRGASGKEVTTSFVDSYMRLKTPTTNP